MMRFLLAVVSLMIPELLSAGDTCSLAESIPSLAKALHARKWSNTTVVDVQRLAAMPLTRTEVPYPADSPYSKECSGAVELTSGEAASCRLTIAFVKRERAGRCVALLDAVSFVGDLPMSRAEGLRADVVAALKPGGRAEGDVQHAEFVWRSGDSRTRYDLFASTVPSVPNPSPATPAAVKVILRQEAVEPADVDDLPFEKGYFPPRCPR
jgi:hypothetical protein